MSCVSFIKKLKNIEMKKKTSEIGAVLITGAAKRIGREVALNLAKMGYDVIISYNKSELAAKNLAKKITKEFSVRCEIFQCDLQDVKQAKKLADFTKKNFSNWNLLINKASIFNMSKFLDYIDS